MIIRFDELCRLRHGIRLIAVEPYRGGPVDWRLNAPKLHVLFAGHGELISDTGKVPLVAPCAWIGHDGERMRFLPAGDWQEIAIALERSWEDLGYTTVQRFWPIAAPGLMYGLFGHIRQLAANVDAPGCLNALASLVRSLLEASFATNPQAISDQRELALLRRAEQWRRDPSQLAAIDDIAEQCGLSPAQFRRRWKQRFNMTPIVWLTNRRMELACELLMGNMPIGLIARHVGYPDQRYFASVFRRYYGQSPSDWRRYQRGENQL